MYLVWSTHYSLANQSVSKLPTEKKSVYKSACVIAQSLIWKFS